MKNTDTSQYLPPSSPSVGTGHTQVQTLNSNYASKPSRTSYSQIGEANPEDQPLFTNVVHLKTMDSNLYLGFGFSLEPVNSASSVSESTHTRIMLGPETAKQLLFSLAELFDCEIRPKP